MEETRPVRSADGLLRAGEHVVYGNMSRGYWWLLGSRCAQCKTPLTDPRLSMAPRYCSEECVKANKHWELEGWSGVNDALRAELDQLRAEVRRLRAAGVRRRRKPSGSQGNEGNDGP